MKWKKYSNTLLSKIPGISPSGNDLYTSRNLFSVASTWLQKAVENHVNGAVWAFDYDKMFWVLMENEICRKVCEKNKYNSWTKLIGQYCVSMA